MSSPPKEGEPPSAPVGTPPLHRAGSSSSSAGAGGANLGIVATQPGTPRSVVPLQPASSPRKRSSPLSPALPAASNSAPTLTLAAGGASSLSLRAPGGAAKTSAAAPPPAASASGAGPGAAAATAVLSIGTPPGTPSAAVSGGSSRDDSARGRAESMALVAHDASGGGSSGGGGGAAPPAGAGSSSGAVRTATIAPRASPFLARLGFTFSLSSKGDLGGSRSDSRASGLALGSASPSMGAIAPTPPTRVDTDDDLLHKQVMWEIERTEIEWGKAVKLGMGAYGEVWRAKWRGTDVAVKKVNLKGGNGNVAVQELRHEIAVMSHMVRGGGGRGGK